jgi:hypothetical protein
MPVKGGYLLVAGGGIILLWSGIKGHSWSTVLKDVLSGHKIDPNATEMAIVSSPTAGASGGSGSGSGGPVGGSRAKNMAIGKALATAYGWGSGQQWDDLVKLWNQESGWDNKAQNQSSGAYGIPQALPASKMGALANPPISSASAQIAWGLRYIKQRYGSPSAAWAHEVANNWY